MGYPKPQKLSHTNPQHIDFIELGDILTSISRTSSNFNAIASQLSEAQDKWPRKITPDIHAKIIINNTAIVPHYKISFHDLNRKALDQTTLQSKQIAKECPVQDTETAIIFTLAPIVFLATAFALRAPGSIDLLKFVSPPLAVLVGGYATWHLFREGWNKNRHPIQKILLYMVASILVYELWLLLATVIRLN